MKTMKIRKESVAGVLVVFGVLLTTVTASASWTTITYDATDPWGGDNIARVNGGADTDGYYYTSTKPGTGDWTLEYNMAPIAYDAAWCTTPMSVWSADNVWFQTFGTSTNDYNTPSDIQIKVSLSEAVTAAEWTNYFAVYQSSGYVRSEYSINGTEWTALASYDAATGDGNMYSYTYDFSFAPTTELYLRLNADSGAVWLTGGGSGNSTVTFVPEPATMALLAGGVLYVMHRKRR